MKQTRVNESISGVYEQEHFVHFYRGEDRLMKELSNFIGAGLIHGDPCIVVATPEHCSALEKHLTASGHDIAAARKANRYISLDAAATLASFMDDNLPNKARFKQVIGKTLEESQAKGRVVRVFGEMVALLWSDDNQTGAILLEQLWNELAREHSFTLFCGYPMHYFENIGHSQMLEDISRLHSSAILPKSIAV